MSIEQPAARALEPLPELLVEWDVESDLLYLSARKPVGMLGDDVAKGLTVFFDPDDEDSDEGYGEGVNGVMLMDASKVLGPYLEAMLERQGRKGKGTGLEGAGAEDFGN